MGTKPTGWTRTPSGIVAFIVAVASVIGSCGSGESANDSAEIGTSTAIAPATNDDVGAVASGESRVETVTVDSAALAAAVLDENTDQSVNVYLPPSYDTDQTRRFPVIYLLNGFGESNRQLMGHRNDVDRAIAADGLAEFIVVERTATAPWAASSSGTPPCPGTGRTS